MISLSKMTYVYTTGVNFRDSDQCDQAMRRDVVKCAQRKGNISHLDFQARVEEDGKAGSSRFLEGSTSQVLRMFLMA